MRGTRKRLAELEGAIARLEKQDLSPAMRDEIVCVSDATLTTILVSVRAAIAAGVHDKGVLLEATWKPLTSALAKVPAPAMESALMTVVSTLVSRIIDRLLELEQAVPRN